MTSKRTRTLLVLSVLCLVLSIFASPLGAMAEGASGETVQLEWFLTAGSLPTNWDRGQYVMNTISEKTGVTVNMNVPAQDADTKLNLMIVSGSLPDIITLTNATLINDLVTAGLVWNLEDLFKTHLPDSHLLSAYPEDIKAALTRRDGGWYSLPSHILSEDNRDIWGLNDATKQMWLDAENRSNQGIIFNRTIMNELGIAETDLQTESGLLAALDKVKQAGLTVNGASVYPLLADGANYYGGTYRADGGSIGALAAFFGAMPVNQDGNYQSLYYTEQFKHALKFLNTCARNGYVDTNQFTIDSAGVEAACRSGRVFCFVGNTAGTGFAFEGDWFTPGPILSDGGEAPVLGINKSVQTGWLQTFVSTRSKNTEAAAKFIDYMSSRDGLILWNYGEDGVDFETSAEGLIKRTAEGTNKFNNGSVTGVGAFWAFCNQNFDRSIMDPSTDPGVAPQSKYGAHEKTYVYDTAVLDATGYVQSGSEYATIEIEVKNYIGNQLAKIILEADDATFDEMYQGMISELDKLGLQKHDEYINQRVQENAKALGYSLKPVN